MRDANGSGLDGVGGATGLEPGDVNGGDDTPVYANNKPASQAENEQPSFERARDPQQLAEVQAANRDVWRHEIDCDVIHLKRLPPAEHERRLKSFRNGFARLMKTRTEPQLRLEAREAYSKVWTRWRRRSVAKYSEALRDQIFAEAEIEREVWAVGWGRVANLPLFKPPMPAEADAILAKYSGRDRFVAWLVSNPHLLPGVIPHLQDRDVPRDLVLFIYRFVLVAVREPDKMTAFRLEYPDVFNRLKRPLLREAQARVDALNVGTTVIINEEPAVDEPVKPAVIEVAPPVASSFPPDDQAQLSAEAIGLGLYMPDLPPDVRVEYMDAIAGLLEHERAPVGPPEIGEELPAAPPAAEESRPRRAIDNAFENANFGWPAFPCDPKTKKPLTPREKDPKSGKPINGTGWRKQATTDFGIIRYWWAEYPNAMVGIPTGKAIGAFVLEIDVADKAGNVYTTVEAQIAAVEAEIGVKLPPTMRVNTPRGGAHLYFRSDYGFPRNSASIKRAGKQLIGVDVRGEGGYVIAAGSVREDGKSYEWASDNRDIAMAPVELVDWCCGRGRWAPEQTPPAESLTTAGAHEHVANPAGASCSGTRKAPMEVCEKWTATALQENAAELAAANHGRRNTLANIISYRIGRMVAAGWITERTVINVLFAACEANGLVQDDGADQVRATIVSGLAAGKRKPLRELPDRPRKPWQPIDGDDDNWWLRGFRSEIHALYRMRFPSNPAAIDEADRRLWEIVRVTFDPWVIGEELRLTLEEYKRLACEPHGRKKGPRLPAKMKPADVSREDVEAFRKDRKRTQNLTCQTKKRGKKKATQQAINDLDDKESALHAFLQNHPGPQSVDEIYEGVRRSRAFKGMKPGSIKNTIRRLIDPPSEKLRKRSRLVPLITMTKGTAKNRGSKILVELRKNEI